MSTRASSWCLCLQESVKGLWYKKNLFPFIDSRKPNIIKAPGNQSAHIGSNVTFNCTVNGDPAPAVNWTKDGNLLPFNQKVMTNLTTGESQLVITGVINEDIGQYRCVASNRMGCKESKAAVLSLMVVLPGGEEGMYSLTSYLPSYLPSFLPSFLSSFHLSILHFFQSDASSSLTPCKQVSRFKFKFPSFNFI